MYKLDQPPLMFESSRPGRRTAILPPCDVPERPLASLIPVAHQSAAPPALPELSELDVVRHYTNLSTLNMSIDSNFYPLGSCTMKYNPKRNERLAALPGLAAQHPYQDESTLQGLLAILFDFKRSWPRSPVCPRSACSRRPVPGRADGPVRGRGVFPRQGRTARPRS